MIKQPFTPSLSGLTRERFGTHFKTTLDIARTRLLVICAVFCFGVLIISGRLLELTLLRKGEEPTIADLVLRAGMQTGRADILDRNGQILATTLTTSSLYANAKQIINPQEAAKKLLTVLPPLNAKETLNRLTSDRPFIWLARHLTPLQRQAILRLGIPGLGFMRDQRRIYPQGPLVSHVLGYTDIDNRGIAGIEKGMDDQLSTQSDPLYLSLDSRLQHIVRDELTKGIEEFGALSGCGAILDCRSGEILAMVSLPDFNPNQAAQASEESLFNKVTLGIYEVGSIMKIANTALALDAKVATLSTKFDATHPLKVGRFSVTDFKGKNSWLSVAEIFVYSSNIGTARMALAAGTERQRTFLQRLGFLDAPKFELPEVTIPLVPKRWRDVNTITISYGYGLSLSPLQLMSGVGGILNQGILHPPTLIKADPQKLIPGRRVTSTEVSSKVLQLMRLAATAGTGRKANIQGYHIFTKTGTSNLRVGKHYQKERVMANFIGALGKKSDEPQYIIYVMLEDPKRLQKTYGYNNAGWNAAPIGGKIIGRLAPLMGIMPFETEPEPADPFLRTIKF